MSEAHSFPDLIERPDRVPLDITAGFSDWIYSRSIYSGSIY
jgi:hypothetical protein